MAALFGNIGMFDGAKEEWAQYIERLDYLFTANGITDGERKRAIMLTTIGPESYKTLRSLIAPTNLGEISYRELADKMKSHYSPAPSEIVQRFKFNSRFRNPGELLSTFV